MSKGNKRREGAVRVKTAMEKAAESAEELRKSQGLGASEAKAAEGAKGGSANQRSFGSTGPKFAFEINPNQRKPRSQGVEKMNANQSVNDRGKKRFASNQTFDSPLPANKKLQHHENRAH